MTVRQIDTIRDDVTTKVDVVLTWVDGSDPEWLAEKNRYSPTGKKRRDSFETGEQRYRDWNLLPYWFRGIEENAPWVNRIHFVTWGHVPKWLNTSHPKLHVVKHSDFIPEEYLPTFNSHAIELNLHRIEGITNQFVYFNDDMFLLQPVTADDFFRDRLPVDYAILDTILPLRQHTFVYQHNAMRVVNAHFDLGDMIACHKDKLFAPKYGIKGLTKNVFYSRYGVFAGFHNDHLPLSFLCSTLKEIWEKEPSVLDETCLTKFRDNRNVTSWIVRYWQLATGNFVTTNPRSRGTCFAQYSAQMLNSIRNREFRMVCINDLCDTQESFARWQHLIEAAFASAFPTKSGYEV